MVHQSLQRWRVPLGFAFALIFLACADPDPGLFLLGCLVALSGLLLRIWAAGHLRKHRELAVSGPYRWTRNPLYLGSFLLGTGFSLASGLWWIPVLFVCLYSAVYLPVIRAEERELRATYGAPVEAYLEQVPAVIPYRKPWPSSGSTFSWTQVRKNREYNAVFGFLFVTAVLWAKLHWL